MQPWPEKRSDFERDSNPENKVKLRVTLGPYYFSVLYFQRRSEESAKDEVDHKRRAWKKFKRIVARQRCMWPHYTIIIFSWKYVVRFPVLLFFDSFIRLLVCSVVYLLVRSIYVLSCVLFSCSSAWVRSSIHLTKLDHYSSISENMSQGLTFPSHGRV